MCGGLSATRSSCLRAIRQAVECTPIRIGWNDTYRVTTITNSIYMVRIYGVDRHELSAIHYELDPLLHLAKQGVSVSVPIAHTDGLLITPISVPEGRRYIVLFSAAPGRVPDHAFAAAVSSPEVYCLRFPDHGQSEQAVFHLSPTTLTLLT